MTISSIQNTAGTEINQPGVSPQQASERRDLIKAGKIINQSRALGSNNELVFSVDRATHKRITRVIDRNTNEVLLQVPAEYVLRLAEDVQNGSHFSVEY